MTSAQVESQSVCFVAAPLVARSGVYNSARETVAAARAIGLNWSLLLGVSSRARGGPSGEDPPWIQEIPVEPSGIRGVRELEHIFRDAIERVKADVVVSMVPQSDMALSRISVPWVAYLRGKPWPSGGEANRVKSLAWKLLERRALSKAADIWVTTSTLLSDVPGIDARIVPAGIQPPSFDIGQATSSSEVVVWAARFDRDKDPGLFLRAMSHLPDVQAAMYGTGPLEEESVRAAPGNVAIKGWVSKEELWANAAIYVGSSRREAFGRSAVEAAMVGKPVILSAAFGAAPLLYTDDTLRRQFVLHSRDPKDWAEAVRSLLIDRDLYQAASQHVYENSQSLTIARSVEKIAQALQELSGAAH